MRSESTKRFKVVLGESERSAGPDEEPPLVPLRWHRRAGRALSFPRSLSVWVGPPGVGKSAFARARAREVTGLEPVFLQGAPGVDEVSFWGRWTMVPGEGSLFRPGPVFQAVRDGLVLIIEEFLLIPLAELANLLPIRSAKTVTCGVSQQVIPVHPRFRMILTSNPLTASSCRRDLATLHPLLGATHPELIPELTRDELQAVLTSRFPGASRELLTWSIDTWESFRHQARRKDTSDPSPQLGLRNLIVLLERIQDGEDRWEAAEVAFVNAHLLDSEGHAAAKLQLQMMLPGQDR